MSFASPTVLAEPVSARVVVGNRAAAIAEFRGIIVSSLRETQPIRRELIDRDSLDDLTALERVFAAYASAGRWNREHPEIAITADEIAA